MSKTNYKPRMKTLYNQEIQSQLKTQLKIENIMLVPKIEKIVINMGLGNAKANKNSLKQAEQELALITGQKLKK